MKKKTDINISPEELKAIVKEYDFDIDNDTFNSDDRLYYVKKALNEIDKADKIIYCLYLNYQSERKVAALLGVSRTPVNRMIKKITEEIREKVYGYLAESTDVNSDNRVCN